MNARARNLVSRLSLSAVCLFAFSNVWTRAQGEAASSRDEPTPSDVARAIERARGAGDAALSDSMLLGRDLLRKGRHAEAAQLFKALLGARPREPMALYGAALALFNLGIYVEAEPLARAAVEVVASTERSTSGVLKTDDGLRAPDALVLLAVIQAVRGDDAGAAKSAARAVELAPGHFDAQFTLGRALYGAGDVEGAARAFRAAVALNPDDARARFFHATALEKTGDLDRALSSYRELVARQPRIAEGHLGLGVLLLRRGDDDAGEGMEALRRALAIKPDLYEARVTLGRALVAGGRYAEAISHLRRAAELAPDNPEPHYQLSIAYRRLGRKEEAAEETAIVKRIHEARRGRAVADEAKSP